MARLRSVPSSLQSHSQGSLTGENKEVEKLQSKSRFVGSEECVLTVPNRTD